MSHTRLTPPHTTTPGYTVTPIYAMFLMPKNLDPNRTPSSAHLPILARFLDPHAPSSADMTSPYESKEGPGQTRSAGSTAERDRADLARVGKKEVLKVRFHRCGAVTVGAALTCR
jgi:hypothetical protein